MMRIGGQLGRFGLVGGVGFVVDGGLLWSLSTLGWSPYAARLVSFPAAVLTTWALHRVFTFPDAAKTAVRRQVSRYFGVQILGSLVNFVVFYGVLLVINETPATALVALAIGTVFGLVVNFAGARWFVFSELSRARSVSAKEPTR